MVWQKGQYLQSRRYIIERTLGEGGFGITYLAKDNNGKSVVIKTLKNQVQRNDESVAKLEQDFYNEALKLARCDDPHIVKVHEIIKEGTLPCIVMEYIEGQNLGDIVKQRGIFPEEEALNYIRQIGQALTVVHHKDLLHRDVKPENIMVRAANNEAVLIDFGLARNYSLDTTIRYSIAFTPNYAPLEQYSDEDRWGPFVDVYALAATLYYLLTKTLPVSAISRSRGFPLKNPNQINPTISAGVNQAIIKGMELESRDRPQTIQEWLRLLDFEPVPTVSSPVFEFDVVTVNIQGQIIERRRKKAKYFTEKLSNDLTLEMVAVPGGTFTMGSPASEKGSFKNERPQHQVTIKPFFMGKYPVTQTQWRKVAALPKVERDLKPNPSWFKGDNRPVEYISWYDAVEFCA